ncbi:hypothetical protein OTU49_000675 [Cherax quadricarinatus]|uniref:Metalloendopeptidase n=1 Tax=Cherax quadricarinatus TaxID=27406 RepID=A0AAW0XYJ8_CHEQU
MKPIYSWLCVMVVTLCAQPTSAFVKRGLSIPSAVSPVETMRDFMETNPEEVEGKTLYQSDMLLSEEQWQSVRERKAMADLVYRWPNGGDGYPIVPYVFDGDKVDREACVSGMDHWMKHTCIKFAPTTNTNQPHLRFMYGPGCYSYVGRILYFKGQEVSIGNGCNHLGIVVHEVGHAIGFAHEHSRPDRDEFVHINNENIIPSQVRNFEKRAKSRINNFNIIYDLSSIMHYSDKSFSINRKPTISTLDPLMQGVIGQRDGLSHRDKLLANKMYNCINKWLAKCHLKTDPCRNEGYLGASCKCVCPPGTSGTYCQVKTGSYYTDKISACSERITRPGIITSPNFPNNYHAGVKCVKLIVAPKCFTPRLTFTSFKLYGKSNYCDGKSCCYFDNLEIRTKNPFSGDIFCGTEIAAGRSFTSTTNTMILNFQTLTNFYKGWSAEVTFHQIPTCRR